MSIDIHDVKSKQESSDLLEDGKKYKKLTDFADEGHQEKGGCGC